MDVYTDGPSWFVITGTSEHLYFHTYFRFECQSGKCGFEEGTVNNVDTIRKDRIHMSAGCGFVLLQLTYNDDIGESLAFYELLHHLVELSYR